MGRVTRLEERREEEEKKNHLARVIVRMTVARWISPSPYTIQSSKRCTNIQDHASPF